MKNKVALALIAALPVLLGQPVAAGSAPDAIVPAGQLAHALDRVARTGRVLYVAAHPDDENTRLLAWLANDQHLLAGYLSMTRGGGGQNLVGQEQGDLLDVIRTEELLAARGIDGAVQRFTRMRDFGYSKTASETFATWGHQEALADVVWVIRTFQPDVIITRFDEEPPNHGHHTASAILAREAFSAAADPKQFKEQLVGGVTPWQADRLLRNIPTWRDTPIPADALALDIGAFDARLGLGYGELAALSRSRHASQGFGVAGDRGPLVERFSSLAGTRPTKDLLEGLDLGWTRFGESGAALAQALDEARAALDRDHPERALPALVKAHRAFDALPDVPRVRDGRRALDRVIAAAAGLFARATAPTAAVVPGSATTVELELVLRQQVPLKLLRIAFPEGQTVTVDAALVPGERKLTSQAVTLRADAPVSAPHWLAEAPLAGHHVVRDQRLVAEPKSPPALSVGVELSVGGDKNLEDRVVRLDVPVVHSWVEPTQGERTRAVLVVPPATVTPARESILCPNGAGAPVVLRVRAGRDGLTGEVTLPLPKGWKAEPTTQSVTLEHAGDEAALRFVVTPPKNAQPIEAHPTFTVDGKAWSWREATIDHPHVPLQVILQPATIRIVPLTLALPPGRVGYIKGSGDSVADDLAHVGLNVEVIDDDMLRSGDLERFAAIVVGIRAWNTRDSLRSAQPRLMSFVEQGGTLVVQYNTNNRLSPLTSPLGPYPFEIGRDRITDQTAVMTAVDPMASALHRPNELTAADFDGWVQERGIYFASKWDDKYAPLFSAQDPGEEPVLGGTLIARHGKGRYVYTGLAFFRQLPAGVPGAYRLFVNLIARD